MDSESEDDSDIDQLFDNTVSIFNFKTAVILYSLVIFFISLILSCVIYLFVLSFNLDIGFVAVYGISLVLVTFKIYLQKRRTKK